MTLRKLDAINTSQVTPGMLVRIVEPYGAAVPEVKAAGGGEMYARGAYGRVMEIPGGNGMGVKFHPTMLHDLQTKGYVKLSDETIVEPLDIDSKNDLLEAAATYLNNYTDMAQPLLNSGRQAVIEAAVANLTFEHDRLADMIADAEYTLNPDIAPPVRNFGEGRLEREAERVRQAEADAVNYYDGDDDDDNDDYDNDDDQNGSNVVSDQRWTPVADTSRTDNTMALTDARATSDSFVPGIFVRGYELLQANASIAGTPEAPAMPGMPTIPEQLISASSHMTIDPDANISVDDITAEDLGLGHDLGDDEPEVPSAPHA